MEKYEHGSTIPSWLFIGSFPAGWSYADRTKSKGGDYHKIAFVYRNPVELVIYDKSPKYKEAVKLATRQYDELNGDFSSSAYAENTSDDEQSHLLKYKGYYALRVPYNVTQGIIKIYKDGELKNEFDLQDGYSIHNDGRQDPWFITDKSTRRIIDNIIAGKYAHGGTTKHEFRAYTILPANKYGQIARKDEDKSKSEPTKFYIAWSGNSYQLWHFENRLMDSYVVFEGEKELKKAIDKVRYSSPTNVNYGLSPDQKFYKEYLPLSEKFDYAHGGTTPTAWKRFLEWLNEKI